MKITPLSLLPPSVSTRYISESRSGIFNPAGISAVTCFHPFQSTRVKSRSFSVPAESVTLALNQCPLPPSPFTQIPIPNGCPGSSRPPSKLPYAALVLSAEVKSYSSLAAPAPRKISESVPVSRKLPRTPSG